MKFLYLNRTIDFLGYQAWAFALSIALTLITFVSLGVQGLNLGIDFTGGTLVEVGYSRPVELQGVREALSKEFEGATVQHFGSAKDVLVRLPPRSEQKSGSKISDQVQQLLSSHAGAEVELRRVEFVGPQVGNELVEQGGLAIVVTMIGLLIYIAMRFEYRFAIGAVIATLHDPILILGFFSVFRIEFDLTVLAAVLAIIGYSINDTIVVFDRIREHFRKMRKESTVEIVNTAITQTLSRTLLTSFATLLVVIALLFLGGQIIYGFSLALMIGIVVGTFSSIYVASAVTVLLGLRRQDIMPPPKEGKDEALIP